MKVAHVIVGLDVGGAEGALSRLVLAGGNDVLVISLTDLGAIGKRLQANNVRVEALGLRAGWQAPIAFLRLVRMLRAFGPDVVQTWMYHADLIGGLAARLAGVGVVCWGVRNSLVPKTGMGQKLLSAICAWLSRTVPSAIVCVSKASIEPYARAGYDMSRARVIHNGVDLPAVIAQASPDARQLLRIGCVGRWHEDKGQDVLLAALGSLARTDFVLVLIGRGCSTDNDALMEHIRSSGLAADRIELLGERSDVPALLATLDIFCMPSRTEGFPNGLAEAMASGRACVASDVGDAAELLDGTGTLVPPEYPAGLARALDRALDMTPTDREQMGTRSRERIGSHFSVQSMSRAYNALYRELIDEVSDVRT